MTLGLHENFPVNVHRIEGFSTSLSVKQLQQKLLQSLHDLNQKEFSFEEVANPTVPDGTVIFEFGLAQAQSFSYLGEAELKAALNFLSKERLEMMDFFCAIRYYKGNNGKRAPLKFDYYLIRTVFGKEILEIQIYHERGPRYVSPEDLAGFIVGRLNMGQSKTILKPIIA